MSVRAGYWIGGLIAVLAASCALSGSEAWRTAGPRALGLAWILLGLLGELAALLRALRAAPSEGPGVKDVRPADGSVEVVPLAGVQSEPNRDDPRFRRFRSLEPAESYLSAASPWPRGTPPLLGQVVLVSVFLGSDGRVWSEPEIARAHAALLKAGCWIERQAMGWNAPVNLALADTYFVAEEDEGAHSEIEISFVPEGDGVGPFEARAGTKALIALSRAARVFGFPDAVAWLAQIDARIEADARVWLLFPLRAGRSLAVPLDATELAGVSLAVCYAREASFPEPLIGPPWTDPVTIVHEVLHLFGATDKYGVPLRSFPSRSVTSRDVMRLHEESLSRLRIDPLTAREIGWKSGSGPE